MTNSGINLREFRALCYKYNPFTQSVVPDFGQPGYGNDLDEETIIQQFRPILEEQVKQDLNHWIQTYRRRVGELVTIFETLSEITKHLAQDAVAIDRFWSELEFTLQTTNKWIESHWQEPTAESLWEKLNQQFTASLNMVPGVAHISVPSDDWAINAEYARKLKIWTRKKQVKLRLKKSVCSAGDKIRPLFRKTSLKPVPTQRNFQLHAFLIYFLEIPMARFLLAEWQQFLQLIANQLYELHLTTIEIKDAFLVLDNFEEAMLEVDGPELRIDLEGLQHHVQTITRFQQQLDQFETESMERFHRHEAEIYEKIWQNWHFAGTDILPNSDFDQKKISKQWQVLENQLSETEGSWTRHFLGERGEWQRDIALALLQLQTALTCYRTLQRIEEKITSQVVPVFGSTQESVTALLPGFKTMEPDETSNLRDAMARQNRFLLQILQQEKLPLLVDTLIKAQVDRDIKNWGATSRQAIETLGNEYIILKQRDLNGPIPNSKTETVPILKKAAFEDLVAHYETKYQTFSAEFHQSLEKMFHDISEIDQTAEVSFRTALRPLTQRRGIQVVEEARQTSIEGLNRVIVQLTRLKAKTEELLTLSKTHILQITLDFEGQLQDLKNTETINELYLRSSSIKASEKFFIRWQKTIARSKTTIPALLNVLSGTSQQFQSNYFRWREMAGLTPEKADAEENLSHFLIDTEKHIKALPFVYQRLFRLEPLQDEQFLTMRQKETELLRGEFNRWQNERFAATTIIGERGCGITTLLNFAEKHIYKDYPVIRIDFLDGDTIFTEEALFGFLKSAFKKTDVRLSHKDMIDLENKINALEQRQVFIVENLQQLFLRTSYGFEALERFMLFISRTHQKIHWVMTCAIYSWEYLAKVINIDEYIQQKIVLDTLPQSEVEDIILKRHRASGYQLLFQPTAEIANSRRFNKLDSEQARQAFLQNQFFRQLTELAAGNITVGILLWLRSYKEVTQNKLIIPANIDFDPIFLYQLPPEELFTLVALLQHDILSAEHHALVFHQEIQQSLLLLNRMANKGFLVQKSNGYQIHPFLYRPVVRVLKSGNIIH